jgi:hypothetical protein
MVAEASDFVRIGTPLRDFGKTWGQPGKMGYPSIGSTLTDIMNHVIADGRRGFNRAITVGIIK